jgi:hypothetical protein
MKRERRRSCSQALGSQQVNLDVNVAQILKKLRNLGVNVEKIFFKRFGFLSLNFTFW